MTPVKYFVGDPIHGSYLWDEWPNDRGRESVYIEWRTDKGEPDSLEEGWAVIDTFGCIGRDLKPCRESLPSNRKRSWLKKYRFTLAEAERIAQSFIRQKRKELEVRWPQSNCGTDK